MKLIVFGIVMSLIPMLILAVIGIRSGERGISIHTAGHLTSVAALKGDQISDWINVQTDGALASLREGVSTPPVQRGERASWWLTASFIDGATGEVTGIPIQSLNAAPPFGDGADFVANSSAEPRLELLGAAGGAAGDLIRVTRPAELRPGESGVLVTDIDAAGLAPLLEPDVGLGPDGRILILNAEGVLLYTGRGIASTLTPPMFRLTEKPGHVHEFQDADGTDLVGKAMEFPGSPWYVVVTLPRSQAFSEVGDLKTSIAIALIVVSLVAIAVSWFVGRSIARPVSRLAEGVRSYTLGERFEAPPSCTSHGRCLQP
ncbi:MAG: cache domain-containing protein [Chloroflexi bacterium]|nr:cache domain-containing protein [Chloroflexota bacterium]